jgi:hypothetical protein
MNRTHRIPKAFARLTSTLHGCLILLLTSTAQAQSPAAVESAPLPPSQLGDPAAADAMFQRGLALRSDGQLDAACGKFEESYRLEPDGGALGNVADCREKKGKVATAWALFRAAARLADIQGEHSQFTYFTERANGLKDKLSYLTLHVADANPGLEVKRDNAVVGRAQFDIAVPIDPGPHTIAVNAPGYTPVTLHVVIGEKADNQVIALPPLQPLATPAARLPHAPPLPPPPRLQQQPPPEGKAQPWPWLLGGVGATALVVGGVSGVLALHDKSRVQEGCNSAHGCQDPESYALQSRRDAEWTLARITFPIGVAALGAAVTWLTLENAKPEQLKPDTNVKVIGATANSRGSQLWVGGSF